MSVPEVLDYCKEHNNCKDCKFGNENFCLIDQIFHLYDPLKEDSGETKDTSNIANSTNTRKIPG